MFYCKMEKKETKAPNRLPYHLMVLGRLVTDGQFFRELLGAWIGHAGEFIRSKGFCDCAWRHFETAYGPEGHGKGGMLMEEGTRS